MKMIGDVLTSSILFEAIRSRYPDAELHYLIYKHTLPVVENNPFIDKYIIFDPDVHKSAKGLIKMIHIVKEEKYDVVIDVYSKINSAAITMRSGASEKISFKKWYTKNAYSKRYRPATKSETPAGLAIENRMLLLKGLGKSFPKALKPRIYLTQEEKNKAKQLLMVNGIDLQQPLYMIGILGSSESKSYPKPYMAMLLNYIVAQTKAQLIINYIPSQKDTVLEILELCEEETRAKINLAVYGKNLREFMALTSYCNAIIGNEGGAVNMAKALSIPSFSIFSPQIFKADWNLYEDGLKNVGVHLNDYRPELFIEKDKKDLRKEAYQWYWIFKPDFIYPDLKLFLDRNK